MLQWRAMKAIGHFLPALFVVFLTACGPSQKDIDARDARIKELEERGAVCDRERNDCNEALAAKERELADAKAEIQNLETLVASISADKETSQAKIDEMKKALEELREKERQTEARLAEFRSMLSKLKSMIDSGKLRVRIVRNRMVVELREAVLFDSGKADVKDAGKELLAELAPILTSVKNREFQVGGHTDNVPIKTPRFPSNWELSAARAVDVLKILIEAGLAPTRISAAGYADTQPVASNDSKESRAQNRRIEIALLPNLDELPDLSVLESGAK